MNSLNRLITFYAHSRVHADFILKRLQNEPVVSNKKGFFNSIAKLKSVRKSLALGKVAFDLKRRRWDGSEGQQTEALLLTRK